MNLSRKIETWPSGRQEIEWIHWISRSSKETLEGREAEIAEEAYQEGYNQGAQDAINDE
jgi:hypothetical protein